MRIDDYVPKPDFNNLLAVLRGERPARPTLFEFYMNDSLYWKYSAPLPADCPKELEGYVATILAYFRLGYDYAPVLLPGFHFDWGKKHAKESFSMNDGAEIFDRVSFETYSWPDPDRAAYDLLDLLAPFIPEGMKLIAWGHGGVFENVTALVGYENLCIMIMEDEELVTDIFTQAGSRFLKYYENCVKYDSVGAIISNDDWGFRSQTLISPAQLRKFVFPWHKRIAAAAHTAGRPAILHSCGQLEAVWEDIICDMKFNGKHSYEDAILPVEQAYEKYQGRIGILGGMDLDFVCRSTPDAVYARANQLIERSLERGGYALGTGNSIPEYTPVENYLAMIQPVLERH